MAAGSRQSGMVPIKRIVHSGSHFSPSGFLVTVTLPGIVSVIDRATGSIAAQFDIAEEYNFIAPTPRLPDSIDLLNFFPRHL